LKASLDNNTTTWSCHTLRNGGKYNMKEYSGRKIVDRNVIEVKEKYLNLNGKEYCPSLIIHTYPNNCQ